MKLKETGKKVSLAKGHIFVFNLQMLFLTLQVPTKEENGSYFLTDFEVKFKSKKDASIFIKQVASLTNLKIKRFEPWLPKPKKPLFLNWEVQ
jgi:hypothetical protein